MMDTLFASTSTPLFSTKWTPSTTGQYAGLCIFIIILAVFFRGLFSYRAIQERININHDIELKRRPIIDATKKKDEERATLDERDIGAGNRKRRGNVPWRITTDVPRALLDTVIAGVGYLLMLAVMTMNVGYFLSVLGGLFLGNLMFGRYAVHYPP